jgi:BD-FAE
MTERNPARSQGGQLWFLPAMWLALAAAPVCAQTGLPAPEYAQWQSPVTGKALKLTLLKPEGFQSNQPLPMIIYLENLAVPRIGTDSDRAIIRDFRTRGYLVAVLDYARNPLARVPFLNRDLYQLRDDLFRGRFLTRFKTDPAHIFIVPSGSRLLRDVVFYRDPGRTLGMDIIYPSHPVKPVGAIIEFSCDNENRMGNASLAICSDTILDAEATEGFAVAMADHPVAPPYEGLDPMPDCAWKIKSAVRTLRVEGARLGMNGNIAVAGFSRGSGMALMLVTTEAMKEFEGHGENQEASSAVQGAVILSGRFTYLDLLATDHMLPRYAKAWGDRASHREAWRREGALDYLDHTTIPLFLTINCAEGADALHQMTVLRQRLAELGNDEIFMQDPQPRGHKVPLAPDILAALDRYFKARLN